MYERDSDSNKEYDEIIKTLQKDDTVKVSMHILDKHIEASGRVIDKNADRLVLVEYNEDGKKLAWFHVKYVELS